MSFKKVFSFIELAPLLLLLLSLPRAFGFSTGSRDSDSHPPLRMRHVFSFGFLHWD